MSVDQIPPRTAQRPKDGAKVVRYHDYIDEKIESTRRMVKVVDLTTALVELAVAVLLFLLLAVVVDHWLVPGGFPVWIRSTLFGVLVVGTSYFAFKRLWPLCIRAINPVYAAQTIEHGSPALQNGLINLLLFRQRRSEIPDAVYRTMEEQAAHGLTRVPVDTAVDRSQLIHLGYVLIAVVTVAGLYKVLSPKDPFVAAERVLMPWADIVPASRVTISEIKPGAVTVSRGEFVDVSADVRGLGEDDVVALRFTTEDGQIVGKPIPLKVGTNGITFSGRLSDDANATSKMGVTRNLTYHLEAGDARSLDYAVTVVPAATILVERVDYHYPAYTGLTDRTVDGIGDIRAIEGTRVTVHARANGTIREANVDFDADGRRDMQMSAAEDKAHVTFDLGLREDRQTPLHASYVLVFSNGEGRSSINPVKHSINVEPDLQPEAEIRAPQEKVRDARVDENVMIEIDAIDPDFALGAVRLHGETAGHAVVDEKLLASQQRRYNGRYVLTPAAHGLKSGDVLEYWVEADDNRTPKPNTVASEHKTLRIISPNPGQQPPPGQVAQNDRQQQQPGEKQSGKQQQNEKQDQGEQGGKSSEQQPGSQGGQGQQSKGDQGQGQGQQSQGEGDKGQGGNAQGAQGGGEKPPQDKQDKSDNKPATDMKQNQTGSGQSDSGNQHGGQGQGQGGGQSVSNDPSSDKPDQQQNTNGQPGAGSSAGQQSQGNRSSNGTPPNGQNDGQKGDQQSSNPQKGQQQNRSQQKGDQQPSAGDDKTPVSSEGDNDAEAFNRIQKHMEQKGDLKQGQQGQAAPDGEQKPGDKSPGEQNQSGDKQPGKPDDKQNASGNDKSAAADGTSDQEGQRKSQGKDSQQSSGADSKKGEQGQGAQTRSDDLKQNNGEKNDAQSQDHAPGGEQSGSKGAAGGGNDGKKEGSPNSKPDMKPTDKPDQKGSPGDKSDKQEPPAGAGGKKESDSHGDQGGDKAGGGSEGGGQKSPHDGTGSAGQNQSADNGAGESGEKGKGNDSPQGGQDAKSDHPTGSSDGKTPGKGSQQRDGVGDKPGGKPPGGKQGEGQSGNQSQAEGKNGSAGGQDQKPGSDGKQNSDGSQGGKQQGDKGAGEGQGDKEIGRQGEKKDGDKQSDSSAGKPGDNGAGEKPGDAAASKQDGNEADKPQDSKSQQQQDSANQSPSGGPSGGNGQPGGAFNPQPSITGETPEGDAANLEYARKQTDLVVDKLADQLKKKKVDDGMLKELGWSEAELRRFVDRWQQRKAAAEKNDDTGETAKRELDDALRSLGLHHGELQQSAAQKDTMRDLHEGYHGPVPAAYKDRLRAYNQGVSRAHRDGE